MQGKKEVNRQSGREVRKQAGWRGVSQKEVNSQSGREARKQAGWREVSQVNRHAEWEAGGQLVKAGWKASMKEGDGQGEREELKGSLIRK